MIIKRKYVASVSRRGKNSQSRCPKQGSKGPNNICLWRGGPQEHVFGERSIPRAIFFLWEGEILEKHFCKIKENFELFSYGFQFFTGLGRRVTCTLRLSPPPPRPCLKSCIGLFTFSSRVR